jgi:hypothetical protein
MKTTTLVNGTMTAAALTAIFFSGGLEAAAQSATGIPPEITTPDKVETQIGTLEFKDGAPNAETVQKVYDSLDFVRGVDAFMNSFSGASAYAIREGFHSIGAEDNTVVVFSELMDSNSLFLTANADTIYTVATLDLTKGPMVVEVPPMALGTINDMWFGWIIDVGAPGPDRGEGGKYLLVPPGYDGPLPDSGFHVGHSKTTHVLYAVRAFMEDNDPKPAIALIKKSLKIYPYTPGGYGTSIATALEGKVRLEGNPPVPPTKFVEGSGKSFNTIPPNDFSYFEMVNKLVQLEPATSTSPAFGPTGGYRHREGRALQPGRPDAQDSYRRSSRWQRRRAGAKLAFRRVPRLGVLPGFDVGQHVVGGRVQLRDAAADRYQGGFQTVATDRRAHPGLSDGVLLWLHDGLPGYDHAATLRRFAVLNGLHGCRQESL